MTDHAATYAALTDDERALLVGAKSRGGEVWDGGELAPDCGTLVARGLVGRYEVGLTQAGHALAEWITARRP